MGGGGGRPDANNARQHPQMGAREHRVQHTNKVSSVMDEMQARTVVPEYPRSFLGLRSMRRQAAASLAHLLVLLGPRATSSLQAPKTTTPVDDHADLPTGFAPAGGVQRRYWNAHDRIEPDRVRTCIHHAAFISMISRALRRRPTAPPSESRGRLGGCRGKQVMSGDCDALTRWHGQFSRSQKLAKKSIAEKRASRVDLFLRDFCGYAIYSLETGHQPPLLLAALLAEPRLRVWGSDFMSRYVKRYVSNQKVVSRQFWNYIET